MSKYIAYFWLLAGLLSPTVAWSSPIGPITKIVIAENGLGPKGEACAAFAITQEQAQAFFDEAVLVSGSQQHDFFLYGPCSARGTLETRYGIWQWEIRSMGTGSITATNGDVFLLGDPEQESVLGDD